MRHRFAGHADHTVTETGAPGSARPLLEVASGINFLCMFTRQQIWSVLPQEDTERRSPNAAAHSDA
jgi:hypothetical protein